MPRSALGPCTGAGVTCLQGLGVGPGPSPVALPCGGAPGEGCGRPGSFKKRRRGQAALSGQGSLTVRAPATPWGTPDPLLLPKRCRQVPAGRRVTAGTERTGAASSPVYRRAGPSAAPRSGHLWPCPAPVPAGSRVAPVPPSVAEAKSTKIRMLLTLPSRGVRIRSILSPYRRGRIPAPPADSFPVSPLPEEARLISCCGEPAGLGLPRVGAAGTAWEGIAARRTARLSRTRLGLRPARVGAWSSGSGWRAGAAGTRGALCSPLRGCASPASGRPLAVPVKFLGADPQGARALFKAT